jgi:hypothetical protein
MILDIGTEEPAIIVEPVKDPFPTEAPPTGPDEEPTRAPNREPAEAPA